MVLSFEDFWRNLPFERLPERFDGIEHRRVRREEDELDAEFVGPLLGEFRMMAAIVVGDEQNPPDRILLTNRF
ncbi:hypothetical protein OB919_11775 [Halobacteria archaeon AArc-curdl1]|uniref:Uncharacterized protein n=1 Tax=Natronosalvus hydrolyticus TaxID=2979988 RepID=A0AAP3E6M8_9EURY|nr:hypothetical protein [Halobacteria archaeon AArc-curdl1]